MKFRIGGYLIVMVAFVAALVSCVDDTFRIDEASSEVTVGHGNCVTLPLGELKSKSIEELLGDAEIPGLMIDENGNFRYSYDGEGSSISIDGVNTEFEIPEIKSSFEVDYPEFEFEMTPIVIEESADITVKGLEKFQNIVYGSSFYIPGGVELPIITGEYQAEFEGDDLHIAFDVPQQIENIEKILFRDVDGNHHGAPMQLKVDLNGLAGINGGGSLSFDLKIEGGTFKILDAENNLIYDGDHYAESYPIAPGAEGVDFAIYVESLTNTTTLDENHHLDIPLKLIYDMAFEIEGASGYFNLDELPHVELFADFEYGDAEVAVDSSVNLMECEVSGGDSIKIAGLPEELKSVNCVTIRQNNSAILDFYAHGLSWLGDVANDVEVVVTLPEYLKLHHIAGETYSFNEATGELVASIADLDRGVQIGIEAFDFGEEGLTVDSNGEIELSFEPMVVARFREGSHVSVSQLTHNENFKVNVGISESLLSIESLSGRVDYAYEVDETFALGGLKEYELGIEGVGIKPIIEVAISHPLTMEAHISGAITPSADGVVLTDNMISFDDVVIPPARYENGTIIPADIILVIADKSLRELYSDPKYSFVECDVVKLLLGALPDTINIKLNLGVNSDTLQTLYITDNIAISYDYKVGFPIALDETFKIQYSDEISGLNNVMSSVSDYGVTVDKLSIMATVTNSTPLEFDATLYLKDADGNRTKAQICIPEGDRILGSSDGVTPKESVVRLMLDLGSDGDVTKLGEVDIVAFSLKASSASNGGSVSLNKNQTVGAKFHLQIDGGVTVDFSKINNE